MNRVNNIETILPYIITSFTQCPSVIYLLINTFQYKTIIPFDKKIIILLKKEEIKMYFIVVSLFSVFWFFLSNN